MSNHLSLPSNVKIVNQFGEESIVRLKMEISNIASMLTISIVEKDSDLLQLNEIAKKCNEGIKYIGDVRKSYTRKLDDEKRAIMAQEKEIVAPLVNTLDRIKAMQNDYIAKRKEAEEIARKAVEARLRQQEAMADKIADAQEQGFDVSEQLIELSEAANEKLPTEMVDALTPIAGVKTRTTWEYRIVDVNKVPRELLTIDNAKVKAAVQSIKKAGLSISEAHIDGIEIFEKTIAVVS